MKQTINIFLCLLLVFTMLTAAAFAQETEVTLTETLDTIEGTTYPVAQLLSGSEDPDEYEMTLYYVNGGDIPYAELSEYMVFLANLLEKMEYGEINYKVEEIWPGLFSVNREDNGSTIWVDTNENTLSLLEFNLFNARVGSSASVSLMDLPESEEDDDFDLEGLLEEMKERGDTLASIAEEAAKAQSADFGEAAEEKPAYIFETLDSGNFNRRGDIVDINLSDYDIDIVTADGKCYIPFQTLNDLLVSMTYTQIVFNTEKVIISYYLSDFFDMMYEVEPREMSEEFAHFNYNELRLFMDLFYGLKDEHNIKDFGTLMAFNTGLVTDLTSTDSKVFDSALATLLGKYFDDGHSGFIAPSWRTGKDTEASKTARALKSQGPSAATSMAYIFDFEEARDKFYPEGVPGYEEVGNTAFITFDQFTSKRDDYYSDEVDLENPQDTIELMMYANQQIRREGSPVKNVVIDLSNNGGGSATAAIAVIGLYMLEPGVAIRDTMTGAESFLAYHVDLNRNGMFMDPEDNLGGSGYNLYTLISGRSFSAGNLTPAAFKQSRRVTLIGQHSGGGSCVVLPATTASGSLFQMSGSRQLSILKNGSFYNIDEGIEPDVVLTRPDSFFDRPALVEFINNMK